MGMLSRVFGKKKATYQPRTYVNTTPGSFGHTRSPSDILVVYHPSPADYQSHIDYQKQRLRQETAVTYISDQISEDLFEESVRDFTDDYEDEEGEEEEEEEEAEEEEEEENVDDGKEAYNRNASAVNNETAQEQWAWLQNNYQQAKAPQVPRQALMHHQSPAARTRQLPAVYQRPERVSLLPRRRSEPAYHATPAPAPLVQRRHHSQPQLRKAAPSPAPVVQERYQRVSPPRPSTTLTPAQHAARAAYLASLRR